MPITAVLQRELNQEQFNAATDPAAEILCLACAGSGKSRTLAYRIARLLHEGASPESIVAFTFTEKAAESIKNRVGQALIASGLSPNLLGAMYIGTIHGFCYNTLCKADVTYRQYEVLDGNKLKLFILSRYGTIQAPAVRPTARYFERVNSLATAWMTHNDELILRADIAQHDADLGGCLDLLGDRMRQDQYIDFSLMIRLVVDGLTTGDHAILQTISSIRHLLVDEYQDVSHNQAELIRLIRSACDTLFVVGDDDQAIYAWRGADVSYIQDFQAHYPGCSVHPLSTNYRSTEAIVIGSAAFVAAQLGAARLPKYPRAANNRSPRDFGIHWFPDRQSEAEWVADRIHALMGSQYVEGGRTRGLTPGDFAILMRSPRNGRHREFTEALRARGILFTLQAGGGPFERPQVAALRDAFELFRSGSPNRIDVTTFFNGIFPQTYPNANIQKLIAVMSDWGSKIHHPPGGARVRLLPQQLNYDLLDAFGLSSTVFTPDILHDIGLFSKMMQDVESVYPSVDSTFRFGQVLNFLQNIAESGYDSTLEEHSARPDSVTVATVHNVKGLEFPAVFLVDVEQGRFPGRRRNYDGWLPQQVMGQALARGAYQGTAHEEARLYYTALTRAERFLYVTGAQSLPGGTRRRKPSDFSNRLLPARGNPLHPEIHGVQANLPAGLQPDTPRQRVTADDLPTTFSEISTYLRCPMEYRFRNGFGFSPPINEMFGFGTAVHTAIGRLHQLHPSSSPTPDQAAVIAHDTFHLKHIRPSSNPQSPGAYEKARNASERIARDYVTNFAPDFSRTRQVEQSFEIPAQGCIITGAIDLLLKEDAQGQVQEAEVIDFKSLKTTNDPLADETIDWVELSLQVQLYAKAAREALGDNVQLGSVHLLRRNVRINVPVDAQAVANAVGNVEWAVNRIFNLDFPRRPASSKCANCDFARLCSKVQDAFSTATQPPEIHLPDGTRKLVRAITGD